MGPWLEGGTGLTRAIGMRTGVLVSGRGSEDDRWIRLTQELINLITPASPAVVAI